jgi:hypothetical protein
LPDVRVLGDVAVIVVIYKRMMVDGVIERERQNCEEQAHNLIALFGGGEQA